MNFLYKREYLHQEDVVVVDCSHQCNVRLLDDTNFHRYRSGQAHRYHGGGFYKELPARIAAPYDGFWNIALDLGAGSANIRHSITIVKG